MRMDDSRVSVGVEGKKKRKKTRKKGGGIKSASRFRTISFNLGLLLVTSGKTFYGTGKVISFGLDLDPNQRGCYAGVGPIYSPAFHPSGSSRLINFFLVALNEMKIPLSNAPRRPDENLASARRETRGGEEGGRETREYSTANAKKIIYYRRYLNGYDQRLMNFQLINSIEEVSARRGVSRTQATRYVNGDRRGFPRDGPRKLDRNRRKNLSAAKKRRGARTVEGYTRIRMSPGMCSLTHSLARMRSSCLRARARARSCSHRDRSSGLRRAPSV